MNQFDVIIPVAGKEVGFVHRTVKYIKKNILGVETVYIITNKNNLNKIRRSLKDVSNFMVLDEDCLVEGLTFAYIKKIIRTYTPCLSSGWYYQQFLKLAFSLSPYAKQYYLSWDADTLPISKLVFFEDNKPLITCKYEYHENYFLTIEKILGLKKNVPFSFIAEHMLFKTSIVKELIEIIQTSIVEGSTWYEKILRAGDFEKDTMTFSEFETYGTFIMDKYPDVYKLRELKTFRRGGLIMGRMITDKMLKKLSIDIDTISIEIRDEPPFPYNIQNKWWRLKDLAKKTLRNDPRLVFQRLMKSK